MEEKKNFAAGINKVKQELKIPYHVLLFFRKTDSLEDVKSRLDELESQKIKPKIITLIDRSHTEKVMTGELMKVCQKYSFDHYKSSSYCNRRQNA